MGIRRLGSKEKGFFYRYPDTGETVREERVLSRIKDLKVPPAWDEARIARSPRAKVQAVGYDAAGRVQYLYSARYREQKEREKFERVLRFADALPEMRRTTSTHLRHKELDADKVLVAMTRLTERRLFQGRRRALREEEQDLRHSDNQAQSPRNRRRHHDLRVQRQVDKTHRKVVTDGTLREVVEECVALRGCEIFKYLEDDGDVRDVKARDLNLYVKRVMGEEFTPKDFRTWAGTLIAAVKLTELRSTTEPKAADKNILEAVDALAERLGNPRDIARAPYISPRVIDYYLEGSVVAYSAEHLDEVIAAEQGDLTDGEKALLDLLKRGLRRDLRKAA